MESVKLDGIRLTCAQTCNNLIDFSLTHTPKLSILASLTRRRLAFASAEYNMNLKN